MDYTLLVEKYISKPEAALSPAFQKSLEGLTQLAKSPQEDIFVISFIGWLLAKVQKKPVYAVTLDLVNNYTSPFHSA
jgi:hypothetical protein